LFEHSTDRSDFVGRLFSRKRPASLTADSPVQDIFRAYGTVAPRSRCLSVSERHAGQLEIAHHFALSENDEKRIRFIYLTFEQEGLVTFRSSQESLAILG